MFLSGCGAGGLKEFDPAQEFDMPEQPGPTICYSYGVLCGKGSIHIEWSLIAGVEGAVFSVQRAWDSRRDFTEISEIRAESGELTFKYSDHSCKPGRLYRYRVVFTSVAGTSSILFETKKYRVVAIPTALHPNHPNPFDAATELRFSVADRGKVSLSVYDVEGRLVRELVDSTLEAGSHTAVWNGQDASGRMAATGVYFCRLRAGSESISRKLVLLR